MLDGEFKKGKRLWMALFCVSYNLHIIHLMFIFHIHEDCDFAAGFLAASFSLVVDAMHDDCKLLLFPPVWFLVALLACYKCIVILGMVAKAVVGQA